MKCFDKIYLTEQELFLYLNGRNWNKIVNYCREAWCSILPETAASMLLFCVANVYNVFHYLFVTYLVFIILMLNMGSLDF